MEPDETSSLMPKHRASIQAVVKARTQSKGATENIADVLDTPMTFIKFSGDQCAGNSSWRTIWADKYQIRLVLLAFVYMCIGWTTYAVSNNILLWKSIQKGGLVGPEGDFALPDLFHDLLGPIGIKDDGALYIMVDMFPYLLFPSGCLYMLYCGETRRIVNLSSVIVVLLCLNAVAGIITIQPDAHTPKRCFALLNLDVPALTDPGWWFLNVRQGAFVCNDMMWSGHTAHTTLGILTFDRVLKTRGKALLGYWGVVGVRLLLWTLLVVFCLVLLATKVHYSADVFVALVLATAFFHHAALHEGVWHLSCRLVGLTDDDADGEYDYPAGYGPEGETKSA